MIPMCLHCRENEAWRDVILRDVPHALAEFDRLVAEGTVEAEAACAASGAVFVVKIVSAAPSENGAGVAHAREVTVPAEPTCAPLAHSPVLPLNGTRTHALSPTALMALSNLAHEPLPRQSVNPGVANRLLREDPAIVEAAELPSPYAKHRGRKIEFLRITLAGREMLRARGITD